ncbi:MAG: hypothetical protein U9Q27_02520 [Patescibacteria group bacterium]|nr:hypothetical protein [Patescibacteria group bacterium]
MKTIGKKNGNASVHSTTDLCPHCGHKVRVYERRYTKCLHCGRQIHIKAKKVKCWKTGETIFKIGKIVPN